MQPQSVTKFYVLLIVMVLVWGLSWPVTKMALQYISPIWFAGLRLSIAAVCVIGLVGLLGKLHWPRRADMPIILVLGLLQIGLFVTLIVLGVGYVDAGRSAILVYTTPLWVMPLAILFFNEQANILKWLGFLLGLLGILILFNPRSFNWSDHSALLGNGILLLAALCWAIAILCARHMRWPRPPLELLPWQLLIGAIPVLLLALHDQPHPHISWNMAFISQLAYIAIMATAFAYWGTIVLSKELPSITLSLCYLGVPVCGLLFSAALLHERITLSMLIAMLCIVSGLACVAWAGRKRHGR